MKTKAKSVRKTKSIKTKSPPPPSAEKAGLKMVIVVRHGEYEDYGAKGLDENGRRQSENLAQKLRAIIPEKHSVSVLSSDHTRGRETAQIIASRFGVGIIIIRELSWDDYMFGEKVRQAMLKSVNGADDVIIGVTHHNAPSGIINAFAKEHFQKEVQCMESRNGNGLMIDLTSGKVVKNILAQKT